MPARRKLKWPQWLALLALLASVGVMLFFGSRAYRKAAYWREHRDEPLHAWMSLRYVAHSYHVPPPELFRALGVPHSPTDRRPLGVIAKAQNKSASDVIDEVQVAIAKIRSGRVALPTKAATP